MVRISMQEVLKPFYFNTQLTIKVNHRYTNNPSLQTHVHFRCTMLNMGRRKVKQVCSIHLKFISDAEHLYNRLKSPSFSHTWFTRQNWTEAPYRHVFSTCYCNFGNDYCVRTTEFPYMCIRSIWFNA